MLRPLDRVRLVDGPYAGRLGIVMHVSSKGTVTLVVEEDGFYRRRILCKPEELKVLRVSRRKRAVGIARSSYEVAATLSMANGDSDVQK